MAILREKQGITGKSPKTDKSEAAADDVIRLKLVGANPKPKITGLDELPGKSNYFIGNDFGKWRAKIRNYGRLRYRNIYPGIDLLYYGKSRRLEHDFVVAAGGDPNVIAFAVRGANKLKINKAGDLVMQTSGGRLSLLKPKIYQVLNGVRMDVSGRYILKDANQIGFEIANYDHRQPLVIDPILSYSTYLGGSEEDSGNGIAIDSFGNAYITGFTTSIDFPTRTAFNGSISNGPGGSDAFVSKLSADGSQIIYSTYLGGVNNDWGSKIAVDSTGNAYVIGSAKSFNFTTKTPLPEIPVPSFPDFFRNAFVAKLTEDGSDLVYSTCLGGSDEDFGNDIAVDSTGSAYVVGITNSIDFPTKNAFQESYAGGGNYGDAFVAKFTPDGSDLIYSTFLGGSASEMGYGIAINSTGSAYVTGVTYSTGFGNYNWPISGTLFWPTLSN